jgi:hypothetical protein
MVDFECLGTIIEKYEAKMNAKMGVWLEEIIAWRKETAACQEATEACLESMEPASLEVESKAMVGPGRSWLPPAEE